MPPGQLRFRLATLRVSLLQRIARWASRQVRVVDNSSCCRVLSCTRKYTKLASIGCGLPAMVLSCPQRIACVG